MRGVWKMKARRCACVLRARCPTMRLATTAATVLGGACLMSESRFRGTDRYVATDDLMMAVNAAVVLGRPLLVKGEPGTGKTQLAEEVALALQRPLLQ